MKLERITCDKCLEFEAVRIARLFPSEEDLHDDPNFSGGDSIAGDPHTSTAVWPGKSNAEFGSDTDLWWLCCPVHPNCGHEYRLWVPSERKDEDHEDEEEDDLQKMMREASGDLKKKRDEFVEREQAKFDVNKASPFHFQSGVWREETCACEVLPFPDNWLEDYIRSSYER
jgi:hypothetical protein